MHEGSLFKKILLEISFFIGVILAVVLSGVDLIFGVFRYLIGRLRDKKNFNPWQNLYLIWRMIWLHLVYLYRLLQPAVRDAMRANREATHRMASNAASAFRVTGDTKAFFNNLDYVDGVDVFTFFALMPYGIFLVAFLWQALVALAIVIAGYGVYEHRQTIMTVPKAPQPRTVVQYQPQVADQQETEFGPTWLDRGKVFDKVNSANFKNVALLSEGGSIKYSATTAVRPVGFEIADYSELVLNPEKLPNGQIHFSGSLTNDEYTINREQAFMFEGNATKMFMFDVNGDLRTINPNNATKVSVQ